ncbi:hypothetical protein llap_2069 [Limosa lapponica baueri]|uniref:Uncharacterized protein n=1 Tax=Limosa lapponica baueri TaxID=1758121 RepID=A0A2I0UNJ4_LIMLA|nr:hypothetical protein llap_2069 [Limosa lapponica baueri]
MPAREQERWWVWQSHDGTRSSSETLELEISIFKKLCREVLRTKRKERSIWWRNEKITQSCEKYWDYFYSSPISPLSQILFQDSFKNKYFFLSKVCTRGKHVDVAGKVEDLNEAEVKNYIGLKELTQN